MAENKKIDKMIENSVRQVTDLVDVNTIIGKPIKTPNGFHLIPISKVSMGFLSGGGEYGEVKTLKDDHTFAGGSGAVVNLKPCAFLVDDGKECRLLRVSDDAVDELIGKASDMLQQFMSS